MRPTFIFPIVLFLANLPAAALDVSGVVLNKLRQPLGFAQVCLRGTNVCVNSGISNGAFHISGGNAVNPAPAAEGFSARVRGGKISLHIPSDLRASLAWYDAGGRRLAPAREALLRAGAHEIDPPAGPGRGLCFLRLESGNFSVTWKILFLGSAAVGAADGPGNVMAAAPLPKAAALAPALVVTRSGYRTATYFPPQDPDTAVIIMAASGDTGFSLTIRSHSTVLSLGGQSLITESEGATCDTNGQVVKSPSIDSVLYTVRDGKLYLHYAEDCYALLLNGSGADIRGTWTAQGWSALPADIRPQGCPADPVLPPEEQSVSLDRYTIADSSLSEEVTGELCPGDFWGSYLMSGFVQADTAVLPTKFTCKQLAFKNGTGGVATLDFAAQGDSLSAAFVYNGNTCDLKEGYQPTLDPDCSVDPEGTWLDCIIGTGFVNFNTTLAKFSARKPPMSLERPRRAGWTAARRFYQR